MSEHYIVTIDHGHLRIYAERRAPGQATPALDPVEAMDFPLGMANYTDRETDMAGRFQSSKQQGVAPGAPTARQGMSIDERLPMQREEERRRHKELAAEIEHFLQQHPEGTWDFAAPPGLNNVVLELLSPTVRNRLRRAVSKDLVNQPSEDLRAHFAGA